MVKISDDLLIGVCGKSDGAREAERSWIKDTIIGVLSVRFHVPGYTLEILPHGRTLITL